MSNRSATNRLPRGRAFWMDMIAAFEREPSGHTEFVARHDLTLSAFRCWLYRLRDEAMSWDAAGEEGEEPDEADAHFVEVVVGVPTRAVDGGSSRFGRGA